MIDRLYPYILTALTCAAFAVNYGFARMGEPSSAWLWCHVLGAC